MSHSSPATQQGEQIPSPAPVTLGRLLIVQGSSGRHPLLLVSVCAGSCLSQLGPERLAVEERDTCVHSFS